MNLLILKHLLKGQGTTESFYEMEVPKSSFLYSPSILLGHTGTHVHGTLLLIC